MRGQPPRLRVLTPIAPSGHAWGAAIPVGAGAIATQAPWRSRCSAAAVQNDSSTALQSGPPSSTWVSSTVTTPSSRVDVRRGAGTTDPAVAAGDIPRVQQVDVDATAEAPALPVEEDPAPLALLRRRVVGHHLPHRIRDTTAGSIALGEQHPSEGQPVVNGGDEAAR